MMTLKNISKVAKAKKVEGWVLFRALEDAIMCNEFERLQQVGFVTKSQEEVKQWFQQMLDKINAHG
jgi:hypothetical protein